MHKAPETFCSHCGKVVGYVKDIHQPACLANIAPLTGNKSIGNWRCPECGQDIRAWLPDGAVIKTNKGMRKC